LSVFRLRTRLPAQPTADAKTCRVLIHYVGVSVNSIKVGDKADIQFWGDWIDHARPRITAKLVSSLNQRHTAQVYFCVLGACMLLFLYFCFIVCETNQ
jgi:hypothetical protein